MERIGLLLEGINLDGQVTFFKDIFLHKLSSFKVIASDWFWFTIFIPFQIILFLESKVNNRIQSWNKIES